MICDDCGGKIDEKTGFCSACGLEAPNFIDRRFERQVLASSKLGGEEETRQRKARIGGLTRIGRGSRGYVCQRCRELFKNTVREDAIVEQNAKQTNFEEPGTNLYTFSTRQERDDHIRLIHSAAHGKQYYNRADKFIRKLGKFNNESVANSSQSKGSSE